MDGPRPIPGCNSLSFVRVSDPRGTCRPDSELRSPGAAGELPVKIFQLPRLGFATTDDGRLLVVSDPEEVIDCPTVTSACGKFLDNKYCSQEPRHRKLTL